MKYRLLKEDVIELSGDTKLYRVQALKDFGNGVKKGDIGGYLESEKNLSQETDAWVSGNAVVFGNAQVYGNAQVSGDAWVYGNAVVFRNAQVYGNAEVFGNAQVSGDAWVYGNAVVFRNAEVFGNAQVYGNAEVFGNAQVYGNARVSYKVPTLSGLPNHDITILHDRINIGCESHSIEYWTEHIKRIAYSYEYSEKDYELYLALLGTAELLQRRMHNG